MLLALFKSMGRGVNYRVSSASHPSLGHPLAVYLFPTPAHLSLGVITADVITFARRTKDVNKGCPEVTRRDWHHSYLAPPCLLIPTTIVPLHLSATLAVTSVTRGCPFHRCRCEGGRSFHVGDPTDASTPMTKLQVHLATSFLPCNRDPPDPHNRVDGWSGRAHCVMSVE